MKRLSALSKFAVVQIHVNATFNNTHITIADMYGRTIIWASSGSSGFRGKRKKTPYAARVALMRLLKRIHARGVRRLELIIKGLGKGRRGIGRLPRRLGFRFIVIKDVTPVSHNGCRLRKKRRSRVRGAKKRLFRRWREFKIPWHIRSPEEFEQGKRIPRWVLERRKKFLSSTPGRGRGTKLKPFKRSPQQFKYTFWRTLDHLD